MECNVKNLCRNSPDSDLTLAIWESAVLSYFPTNWILLSHKNSVQPATCGMVVQWLKEENLTT